MRSVLLFLAILMVVLIIQYSPNTILLNYIIKPQRMFNVALPSSENKSLIPYIEPKSLLETAEKIIVAKADYGTSYLKLLALNTYTGKGWTLSKIELYVYTKTFSPKITYRKGSVEDFAITVKYNSERLPRLGKLYIIPYPQPLIEPESLLFIETDSLILYELSGMLLGTPNKTDIIVFGVVSTEPYPYSKVMFASTLKVREIIKNTELSYGKQKLRTTDRVKMLALKFYRTYENSTLSDLLLALRNYLNANTTYSTKHIELPPGKDLVDYFLFESKKGSCIHYASAAAVLLREMGFHTRVVLGYLGEKLENGTIIYTEPGHVWVEILIPGVGWISYDPSPYSRTSQASFRSMVRTALENFIAVEGNFTFTRFKKNMKVKLEKLRFETEAFTTNESSKYETLTKPLTLENIVNVIPYIIAAFILVTYSIVDVKTLYREFSGIFIRKRKIHEIYKSFLKKLCNKYGIIFNHYETPREITMKLIKRIPDNNAKTLFREVLQAYEKLRYGKGSYHEFRKLLSSLINVLRV